MKKVINMKVHLITITCKKIYININQMILIMFFVEILEGDGQEGEEHGQVQELDEEDEENTNGGEN